MENIEIILNQIDSKVQSLYSNHKRSVISIGSAVTLTLICHYLYRKLTVPPKKYRHLPCVTYIDLLKSGFKGENEYIHKKNVVLPILNKANGVYLLPTHKGWQIRSANPQFNKYFLSNPELFPKAENLFGTDANLVARFLGGKNVGSVNGEDWKRHRKICNPAFHHALPIQTFGQLSQRTFNYMESIGLDNLDISDVCGRMTLDAIGVCGFGFDFGCSTKEDNEWVNGYNTIRENFAKPFYILFQVFDDQLKWMFPSRANAHKKLDRLLEKIDFMIQTKRTQIFNRIKTSEYQSVPNSEKDLLTLMLEAEYAGEGQLSNIELRDNIKGFFLAGNDTTSIALSFAIGQLARRPDLQKKARDEVHSIIGDAPEDIFPTLGEVKQMVYLDGVIKETLRLHSPLSNVVVRIAKEDTEFEGIFIPKDSILDADILGTHLNEEYWENASEFVPERFVESGDRTSTKDGLKWLPFGHGPHHCLGYNFSLCEQRVFLSMLLHRFEWELTEDSIHRDGCVGVGFTLVRPNDMRINFKKRY